MNWKLRIALFFGVFALITSAQAETSQTVAGDLMDRSPHSRKLYLSGELSGGEASLGASGGGSATGSGSELSAALLASWNMSGYLGQWTWDTGAGIFENNVSGSSSSFTQYQMKTSSLFAKFSPQYHLTESFQIGPVAQVLFGSDVGFEAGIADSGQNMSWLMGAQALYAVRSGNYPVKLGLRYLTSLDLPQNSLRSVEATIQFGVPLL